MPEWWEGTFEERMARRAARRAAEVPEWLRDTPEEAKARRLASLKRHQKALGARIAKPPPKRRGPRGGVLDFDYEEYLTKKADRREADPEEWQRAQRIKREESRAFWDGYQERNALLQANIDLFNPKQTQFERLREIWSIVVLMDMSKRIDDMRLDQASRIANARNNRIKGCGAAAKRAGFAG